MQRLVVGLWMGALLVVGIPAFAQKGSSIVGTWERVSLMRDGKEVAHATGGPTGAKPGVPRLFFGADGFYVEINISTGRPILKTPRDQRTKEELLSQYWSFWGNYGSYSVSGQKVMRKVVAAADPANEGREIVETYRLDGAELVLTRTENGYMQVQKYRRVK
jgi:hypothetical protein